MPFSRVLLAAAALAPPLHSGALIQPSDLVYLGAFRLPDDPGWDYSGCGMTFRPDGDPRGPDDGFPGSLFVIGHDQTQLLAEISIPVPGDPSTGLESLERASFLQGFADYTEGMFGELEIPRSDVEYLPWGGGCIWFCTGQHMQFDPAPSFGICEPDLSNPAPLGPWHAGSLSPYVLNDYLFGIPPEWSEQNLPGAEIACGRFRDGTWGGRGPAIVALSHSEMDLPPTGGSLDARPLLMYGMPVEGTTEIETSADMEMEGFGEADEWSGAAWLTDGSASAVVLVGTKAIGRCWYGYPNGVEYPTSGDPSEQIPGEPAWPFNDRGWWSREIEARILFFDPDDFAEVLEGALETWEPQPYAFLGMDSLLVDPEVDLERSRRHLLGACSFDRENGLLYVVERRCDGDRSLVHVFGLE